MDTRNKALLPKIPLVLVGTQCDLRGDPATISMLSKSKQHFVSQEEGQRLAKQIRAVAYSECSALTQKGLKDAFDEAVLAYINGPIEEPKKRKCALF